MNKRDIVIGIVTLLALAGVIYWRQSSKKIEEKPVPETLSVEDQIESKFKFQIPDDVDRTELKDVTGGSASAISTKDYSDNKFTSTTLADLSNPATGSFYQAWLSKGEEGKEGYELVSLGKLVMAKGGWMIDFESSKDYSTFEKVIVTEEKVFDMTPEKKVLEGSF